MNALDLNAALQYIDDRYLDLADAPQKEIIKMTKQKKYFPRVFFVAAVIAILAVTAYATDFLHIKTTISVTDKSYSSYQQAEKAMKRAGFRMDIREKFHSGFAFEMIHVQKINALDEEDRKAMDYKELLVYYRSEDGRHLVLSAQPASIPVSEAEHPQTRISEYAGITLSYFRDQYRFVPEDYELTPEDEVWMNQPGNYLSYGSDEVEESVIAFLKWTKDDIAYILMDPSGEIGYDVMRSVAEELIAS